jgi:chaperone modulatory protein CbpM
MTRYALARYARPHAVPIDRFAAAAGVHPALIGRLVALGLLDAYTDPVGRMMLPVAQLPRAARIVRLRDGLGLNYTAVGVVLDLLDRIDSLEAALRTRPRPYRR